MSANNAGMPEGVALRPGPAATHPLMEAYARIDEVAAERDESRALVSDLEARFIDSSMNRPELRPAVARALAGLVLCGDGDCEPCSLDQATCPIALEAADDFAAVLDVLGLELRRVPGADCEWMRAPRRGA